MSDILILLVEDNPADLPRIKSYLKEKPKAITYHRIQDFERKFILEASW